MFHFLVSHHECLGLYTLHVGMQSIDQKVSKQHAKVSLAHT